MSKLLSVLCVIAFFAVAVPCVADTVNGTLAEERVVNLPQDAGKWYISVVGDPSNVRYREVMTWFAENVSLKRLKAQVHFAAVETNTSIYTERYKPNVKGLPTVRMQMADGEVVYEAFGANLPMTAGGLYGAMADAAQVAQGIFPLLPWRRDMERRCPDKPSPKPQPDPVLPDEPSPGLGAPVFDTPAEADVPWIAFLVPVGFLVGFGLGYGKKLYSRMQSDLK